MFILIRQGKQLIELFHTLSGFSSPLFMSFLVFFTITAGYALLKYDEMAS